MYFQNITLKNLQVKKSMCSENIKKEIKPKMKMRLKRECNNYIETSNNKRKWAKG